MVKWTLPTVLMGALLLAACGETIDGEEPGAAEDAGAGVDVADVMAIAIDICEAALTEADSDSAVQRYRELARDAAEDGADRSALLRAVSDECGSEIAALDREDPVENGPPGEVDGLSAEDRAIYMLAALAVWDDVSQRAEQEPEDVTCGARALWEPTAQLRDMLVGIQRLRTNPAEAERLSELAKEAQTAVSPAGDCPAVDPRFTHGLSVSLFAGDVVRLADSVAATGQAPLHADFSALRTNLLLALSAHRDAWGEPEAYAIAMYLAGTDASCTPDPDAVGLGDVFDCVGIPLDR